MRRGRVLLVLVAGLLVGWPAVALAHESAPPGVERLEIDLGARQLGVTITTPPAGGGPMSVVLVPRGDTPPGSVTVASVRAGAPPAGGVALPAAPAGRASLARLGADAAGAWELVVTDGPALARIPVDVLAVPGTPGWVWALRIGAAVAVVAVVVAVTPATRRRRGVAPGAGAVAAAGLAVAVTAAVLGPSIPAAPAAPAEPMPEMAGMPEMTGGMSAAGMPAGAVVASVRTEPEAPQVGSPVTLDLALTDGSTGAVVDDLAVHDDALIHLAVIGPDRRLDHVHPVRVAPGRYRVTVPPVVAGRYGVFAELERGGEGGHQVARTAFDVAGPPALPLVVAGPGGQDLGDVQAEVTTGGTPVAGAPSRVAVTFSRAGAPVADLQSWLGMAGHLMVLGPGAGGVADPADPSSTFGHAHDMSAPGPNGRSGPTVAFDHTFARPGRYLLWAQVQRDWQVLTVPVAVDVAAGPASSP